MTEKRKYDSTVARMAGNIAAGFGPETLNHRAHDGIARVSVWIARAILAEVERTEPAKEA